MRSYFVWILLLIAPSYACTTKVQGLYVDDVFKYDTVKNSGIVMGGVAIPGKAFDADKNASYSNVLATQIREERPGVKTVSYGDFESSVGKKNANAALEEFRTTGALKKETVTKLAEKLKESRFLAMARLEDDTVNEFTRHESGRVTTDSRGRDYKQPDEMHLVTERKVTAFLAIYDLKSGAIAFSGSVLKGASNTNSYAIKQRSDPLISINIGGSGSNNHQEMSYPQPSAPDTREVLGKVFRGFAENFPKEG